MEKILVFGSFVVDLMARADHLPGPAETVKGNYFTMGPGGKGFNQGVAAHKVGADVAMVTKLGYDTFAEVALSTMESLQMDTQYLLRTHDTATGTAMVMVDEITAQNQILIVPGSCATITKEEVESLRPLIKESAYILLQLEVNFDANLAIVDIAQEYGVKVILNPAPAHALPDTLYPLLFAVTPNEVEAEMLTGIAVTDEASAEQAADFFFEKGVQQVIITLGSRGVFAATREKSCLIPANKVNAIDTTGAGDAFNGGLVAALANGADLFEACKYANVVAALKVTHMGASAGMPTKEEVDTFLQN